ncbi:MAG: ABC transporter ATP-binding protein [Gammaproteobacteria bacterium]
MQASPIPAGDVLIEATGLARRYGALWAVRGINLRVRRGEVLALLGPNGAGKTTTLSMLTGNLAPHAGAARISGHDLLAAPHAAKRALGYLPEHPPLYPEMSVNAYLAWCAHLRGVPRAACRAAVAEARARCGLDAEGKRLLGHLSKGYRQRAGIAQAIVHKPTVIVLDEPTVGLDPVQIREMRGLIRSLANDAALIVSTHQLAEASEVASHIAILDRGRIVHEARLDESPIEAMRLRLELARPPAPERIVALSGVTDVSPLAEGAFLVTAETGADPREALAAAALAEGWGLLALAPHRASLEELFMAIVSGEREAAA